MNERQNLRKARDVLLLMAAVEGTILFILYITLTMILKMGAC